MKHTLSLSTFCALVCASTGTGLARAGDDLTVVSNVTTNGKPGTQWQARHSNAVHLQRPYPQLARVGD